MIFECQSTWNWDDIDELVSSYPCLNDYNVRSVEMVSERGYTYNRIEITINSLEDFVELSKKVGQPLILKDVGTCIEIYDSYRE